MNQNQYKPKVLLAGPIGFMSGYGEHARYILRILLKHQDKYDLHLAPTSWANATFNANGLFSKEDIKELDRLTAKTSEVMKEGKTAATRQFDLVIHVSVPNEWDFNAAHKFIGVTAGIETDICRQDWLMAVLKANQTWVVSKHSKFAFKTTLDTYHRLQTNGWGSAGQMPEEASGHQHQVGKIISDVKVIGFPVREREETQGSEKWEIEIPTTFNFLSINQLGPRKNVGTLIKEFLETFKDNEEVGLILKLHTQNHSVPDKYLCEKIVKQMINNITGGDKYKCSVYLLHGNLNESELRSLYINENIHCYVSPTHGEGFGLPLFEAACAGMPIVTVPWSGHMDFLGLNDSKGYLFEKIRYTLDPVGEVADKTYIFPKFKWAHAVPGATGKAMKKVFTTYRIKQRQARKLKNIILDHPSFNSDDIERRILQSIDKVCGEMKESYSARLTTSLLEDLENS
jgi:glycosyltransferase involved in cell wall biosynthesis